MAGFQHDELSPPGNDCVRVLPCAAIFRSLSAIHCPSHTPAQTAGRLSFVNFWPQGESRQHILVWPWPLPASLPSHTHVVS